MTIRKGTKWAEYEDDILRKYYSKIKYSEIARILQRTEKATEHRARVLGITNNKSAWEEEEIKCLIENYKNKTDKEMAEILNKSATAINKKRNELNLSKNYMSWSVDEVEYLIQNITLMSVEELAEKLGKSVEAVKCKIKWFYKKMGINTLNENNVKKWLYKNAVDIDKKTCIIMLQVSGIDYQLANDIYDTWRKEYLVTKFI